MTNPQINPQDEVTQLRQQLVEAQKLTALGQLMGTTTHEFNNVLMTVINYAKLGLRHQDEPTRTKALEKIHEAAQRAAKITHSVLGMARNRKPGMEPNSLAEIVQQTLCLLERELSKYRIAVETDLRPAPPARCDGNQIQQVLINLLVNARQAIGEGGEVRIAVQHDPQAGTVDLVVRDNGTGITQDQLPKIFDRYFSTKDGPDASGKGGTGLGLAACRDIIDAHRGRIRVESTVGRGTAFTIKLPAAKAAAA